MATATVTGEKELSVSITKEVENANQCRHQQVARRGKVKTPRSNIPHTLKNLKKQDDEITLPPGNVIKDCQVQMDETSYGDWLIARGLVALSQEPEVEPGVVPNTVKTDMQNHANVSKVTVPEDGKGNNTPKQGGA